uniref:Craniofacial development protein 2-like n=1 Tax=Nicotiana tabacum TaxID=4097 RepID=A0A1S3YGE9_TOBAC
STFGGCLVTGGRCTGKAEQAIWQSQRAGRRVPKHPGYIRGNYCGCPGKREAYGRVERSINGGIKSYFQVLFIGSWDLREYVVEVRRVNDRLMFIKLVIGECTLNVVSTYAPQAGLDEEVKRRFWEGLDAIVRSIPPTKRLFIGGDFNGHIGAAVGSYGEVHGGFVFGDRNGGGTSLLDFTKVFELVIANSTFPKREEHMVTFRSSAVKTQIDYLLLRRCDRGLCKDFKVIPGETLAT